MDKKQNISVEDIKSKDLPRRKFILGAAGTVVATATVAGCESSSDSCSSDTDPNIVRSDADAFNSVVFNSTDTCDSD